MTAICDGYTKGIAGRSGILMRFRHILPRHSHCDVSAATAFKSRLFHWSLIMLLDRSTNIAEELCSRITHFHATPARNASATNPGYEKVNCFRTHEIDVTLARWNSGGHSPLHG